MDSNINLNTTGLYTERLHIRNMTLDDLDVIHQIMNEGFGESPLDARRAWLEWSVRNYAALAYLGQPPYGERAVTLKSTGEIIGIVGFVPSLVPDTLPFYTEVLKQTPTGLAQTEMGLFWATGAAHRGKGCAVEAARAMIDYAFDRLWLTRIVATTEYDNLNSQKVMHKLGMTVYHNPYQEPFWSQIVGFLQNPVHPTPVHNFTPREEITRV